MLRVSKLADYGVIVLTKMAENPLKQYSATKLAMLTGLNTPTIRKILKNLSKAGLLEARRGAEGGYVLLGDISSISVLNIIEAIDGPITFTACCNEASINCDQFQHCQMVGYWQKINKKVKQSLASFPLNELLNNE